jgi:hypothetical protein
MTEFRVGEGPPIGLFQVDPLWGNEIGLRLVKSGLGNTR